jgi:putative hydrolase of the HAD superfamily
LISLVTFDAAGTLIDHCWDPAEIARGILAEMGVDVDEDLAQSEYARVAAQMRPTIVALEKLGDRMGIENAWRKQMEMWLENIGASYKMQADIFPIFIERVFGANNYIFRLFPDVLHALSGLRQMGIGLGIISNWDHTLHTVLQNLGVSDKFDFVIASLEFGFEKPDRRIFEEALRLGSVHADECLHVGDSLDDDFRGASACGISALLIDRDQPADLDDRRISSLSQVVEAVA